MRKRNTTPAYVALAFLGSAAVVVGIYASNNKLELDGELKNGLNNASSEQAEQKYKDKIADKVPTYIKDEQAKYYWEVNNLLLEKYNEKHKPLSIKSNEFASEALTVERIFVEDNNILVLYDVVSKKDGKFSTYKSLCEIHCKDATNAPGYSDLKEFVKNGSIKYEAARLGQNTGYNKKFYDFATTKEDFKYYSVLSNAHNKVTLLDGSGLRLSNFSVPRFGELFLEVEENGKVYYDLVCLNMLPLTDSATESQFDQMSYKMDEIDASVAHTMEEKFDWMSENLKYNENFKNKQQEQSQSTELNQSKTTLSQKRTYDYNDYLRYLELLSRKRDMKNSEVPITLTNEIAKIKL